MKNTEEKVLAICKKTYPCEDGMNAYCDGDIEVSEVKIYFEGKKYWVYPGYYDSDFYELVPEEQKRSKKRKEGEK